MISLIENSHFDYADCELYFLYFIFFFYSQLQ